MKSIQVSKLPDLILNRLGLILYDDLYSLLHHDLNKSGQVFKTIIIEALQEYAKTYPVIRFIYLRGIQGMCITFNDNFARYLDGTICENLIVLKARGVEWIKVGTFVSADYWRFDQYDNTIYFNYKISNCEICYTADYPYVMNIANDGRISEDSRIYFMDIDEDVRFLTFLEYYVLRQIKSIKASIEINTGPSFLGNIDELFSQSESKMQEIVGDRYKVMNMWRK